MTKAKLLTISDGVVAGTRVDLSGDALMSYLVNESFLVEDRQTTSDDAESIKRCLIEMSGGFNGVIVTTGGTGFSPRDVTPEVTAAVIERHAPGFAEYMRSVNPLGVLSRGVAGIRGQSLILNTVGSPKGCVEMLNAVIEYVPHAVALMADPHNPHPHQA